MDKKDISWVVGEAIHFAYEMGCIDTMQNRGQANFDRQVDYVLEHLNSDLERDMLKEILSREPLQKWLSQDVKRILRHLQIITRLTITVKGNKK